MKDLLPILEQIARAGKPLLVLARRGGRRIPGHARSQQATWNAQCLRREVPGFGDRRKAMLEGISTLTGGKAIMEETGIKLDIKLEDLTVVSADCSGVRDVSTMGARDRGSAIYLSRSSRRIPPKPCIFCELQRNDIDD
jgi:hypothetical protein